MTEGEIFQILLKNNKCNDFAFDFPKQQSQTIKIIVKNLTEIIYESYKRKSCASTSKRHQVLKFINNICEVPVQHVYEDYKKCALTQVSCNFYSAEDEQVASLQKKISQDLQFHTSNSFQQKVGEYYSRKIQKEGDKFKKLETINKQNQEKLNNKYHLEVRKKYSFEPNKTLLKKLLGNDNDSDLSNTLCKSSNVCERENQIKLAYAMLNTGQEDILNRILLRISNYNKLNAGERNFLQYIWSQHFNIIQIHVGEYLNMFYFLLEQHILNNANKVLDLKNDLEVFQHFADLESDCNILKIKQICEQDFNCYLKLKTFIHELYLYSYCNENVLKLCDIIL